MSSGASSVRRATCFPSSAAEASPPRPKRNRSVKSRLKTIAKSAKTAMASGDAAAIASVAPLCASVFDKATKSGVIHPNKAARMKSRLAKAANKAKAVAA